MRRLGGKATIDRDLCSGYVFGTLRRKERDCLGDVHRFTQTAKWNATANELQTLLQKVLVYACWYWSRVNRIHSNAVLRELDRGAFGHTAHSPFGCRVSSLSRGASHTDTRGDIYDRRTIVRLHKWRHGLHAQQHAQLIDAEHSLEGLGASFHDHGAGKNPRIVYKDVYFLESLHHLFRQVSPIRLAGHIKAHEYCLGPNPSRSRCRTFIDVSQHYGRTALCQQRGGLDSNSLGSSSHDRDLTIQIHFST